MTWAERDLPPAAMGAREFATTHWSVVLAAGGDSSPDAKAALEQLCQAYWYPLYAFVRRQGHGPEAAQDLTQEFFTRFLESGALHSVQPRQGKFRSFLLASLKHFLANDWHRSQTRKRGGGTTIVSLNEPNAEGRYLDETSDELSPDLLFDRRWAEALIDRVTLGLQAEFAAASLGARFDALKLYLLADDDPPSYAETAARLDMSEGAVRTAIYRMRQRYGELFRAEMAQTVAGPQEMEEEIRHFLAVLGGG